MIINYIGFKKGIEAVSELARLRELLLTEPLDPRFEDYGNFFYHVNETYQPFISIVESKKLLKKLMPCKPYWAMGGNFFNWSFVFSIEFSEEHVAQEGSQWWDLICSNKNMESYENAKQQIENY